MASHGPGGGGGANLSGRKCFNFSQGFVAGPSSALGCVTLTGFHVAHWGTSRTTYHEMVSMEFMEEKSKDSETV